jgi:hypothetical protein
MMTAPRSTASRTTAADAAVSRGHDVRPGATTEAERIDAAFFGGSGGNLANYAMRTGQLHQSAARKLRSIASISARDPRCISALQAEGALTGAKLATSAQILSGFRVSMARINGVPSSMRARFETAKKLAASPSATVRQVAIIADALSQDLYAHGDPQGAFEFAAISGQSVNRVVSSRARLAAQLGKVELR